MREFWIIFKQAFLIKARTKSFIITTAIMIAGVFLFANLPKIIETVQSVTGSGDKEEVLYVVDESGVLVDRLKEQFSVNESTLIIESTDELGQALTKQVEEGEIDSFLTVGLDSAQKISATYTSMSSMEFVLPMMIEDALKSIQTEMQAAELSLSADQVQTLFAPITFEQQSVSPSAKSEEELNQARGLVYVLMFLIYFAVILYSSMIATEVATEKSSRVMEILISSVSPVKHMFTKVN